MNKKVTPYKNSSDGKKKQVTQMFDTIAGNYDRLNRIISFGVDKKWRRNVVRIVEKAHPEIVLDVATGTGDLAIAIAQKTQKKVIGIDIADQMLHVGRQKIIQKQLDEKVDMVLGDSENLAFEADHFDAITVAFGVRNFENLDLGLREIYRVLKPGGIFVVLETSVPKKFPFKQGYGLYCNKLLPIVGRVFSKDRAAYAYLSASASVFPYGEDFNNILRKIGFIEVKHQPQTFGVATIYVASK